MESSNVEAAVLCLGTMILTAAVCFMLARIKNALYERGLIHDFDEEICEEEMMYIALGDHFMPDDNDQGN